jgi:hypothetical protein
MSITTMRLNETWHFIAQPKVGNPPADANYVNPPDWNIADTTIAQVQDYGPGKKEANIRALKVGETTLVVSADGVSSETETLKVIAPFDAIVVTATKN